MTMTPGQVQHRRAIPRGIALDGPAILSYGFRPFFLGAGVFATLSMLLWIGALTAGWEIGGWYGPLYWHAHEMLFGYAAAALAGFMLTAIPNWTGRLPVSGLPLLALFSAWLLGRVLMAAPALAGPIPTMVVEASFLPVLAMIASREIIAGKNWKNLKILLGLTILSAANIAFHLTVWLEADAAAALRASVGVYVALIALVGGRIVPSFTRNWLKRAGAAKMPAPFDRFDVVATAALLIALATWVVLPEGVITTAVAALAALLQGARLWRWRGLATLEEPLLLALHIAYSALPIGLAAVSLAAIGLLSLPSALHILTVGGIGGMTMAVMTRASLGHTGRELTATPLTALAYLALLLATVVRPFAELLPESYHTLLSVSAGSWILSFALFLVQYAPILLGPKLGAAPKAPAGAGQRAELAQTAR